MKAYIAASVENRVAVEEVAREFTAAEIEVYGWSAMAPEAEQADENCQRFKQELQHVAECDVFVILSPKTSHGKSNGDHHVKTGYALALGKPIFLVGSPENASHVHANVREFDSAQEAIQAALCLKPEETPVSALSADSYQNWTRTTALYPGNGEKKTFGISYVAVGCGGEAGEALGKILLHLGNEEGRLLTAGGVTTDEETLALTNLGEVIREMSHFATVAQRLEELKRPMREGKKKLPELAPLSEETKTAVAAEIGDVCWYIARMADELGMTFSSILAGNVTKLKSRKNRGVLHGAGDNR